MGNSIITVPVYTLILRILALYNCHCKHKKSERNSFGLFDFYEGVDYLLKYIFLLEYNS